MQLVSFIQQYTSAIQILKSKAKNQKIFAKNTLMFIIGRIF